MSDKITHMTLANFVAPMQEFKIRYDPRNKRQLTRIRRITARARSLGVPAHITRNTPIQHKISMFVQPSMRRRILNIPKPTNAKTRRRSRA